MLAINRVLDKDLHCSPSHELLQHHERLSSLTVADVLHPVEAEANVHVVFAPQALDDCVEAVRESLRRVPQVMYDLVHEDSLLLGSLDC